MKIFFAAVLSYIIGSIPTGYIIARLLKGIDIRRHGSGNIGATNVARVVGKIPGIITLSTDILKGFIPVFFVPGLVGDQSNIIKIVCVLAVICGHNWTIFLGFCGGKGVATTAGAIIGLMPVVFVSGFLVWCDVFIIWRYVSVASISAAVSLPLFLFLYKEPFLYQVLGIAVAIIGIYRHKENIKRLLKGEEKKFKL